MSSLPTIIQEKGYYEKEYSGSEIDENNEKKMEELFNTIFPDITVPCGYIYEVLKYLQETNVNAKVLPKVIRGVNNLLIGTGKGQVIVHVNENIMNVSVRENDEEIKTKDSY
jgi:hypothetical protein